MMHSGELMFGYACLAFMAIRAVLFIMRVIFGAFLVRRDAALAEDFGEL